MPRFLTDTGTLAVLLVVTRLCQEERIVGSAVKTVPAESLLPAYVGSTICWLFYGSSDSIVRVDGCDSQVQSAAFCKGTSELFAAQLTCPAGWRFVTEVFCGIVINDFRRMNLSIWQLITLLIQWWTFLGIYDQVNLKKITYFSSYRYTL